MGNYSQAGQRQTRVRPRARLGVWPGAAHGMCVSIAVLVKCRCLTACVKCRWTVCRCGSLEVPTGSTPVNNR